MGRENGKRELLKPKTSSSTIIRSRDERECVISSSHRAHFYHFTLFFSSLRCYDVFFAISWSTHIFQMDLARESGKRRKYFYTHFFLCELYSKAIGGETTFAFNGSFICCANWMAASLKIFMRFLPFLRRALNWLAWIASEYYSAQIHFFPPLVSLSPSSPISSARLTHNNISRFAKSQKIRKTIERVNNDEIFRFPRFHSHHISFDLVLRLCVVCCRLKHDRNYRDCASSSGSDCCEYKPMKRCDFASTKTDEKRRVKIKSKPLSIQFCNSINGNKRKN